MTEREAPPDKRVGALSAGLAVLPHFMARTVPGLARVLPGKASLTRTYWLVTHADTRDLARVKLLASM
ncbi:MAG TPA: hypothetical protein PK072_13925 [Quisquiliibacterium sp.]|nr:hypothetical protein [Quisquiliibacterium sp.]